MELRREMSKYSGVDPSAIRPGQVFRRELHVHVIVLLHGLINLLCKTYLFY